MTILTINQLHKSYRLDANRREVALTDINLDIAEAKITAIYGPSGCGKTSLLNILSGLDQDYQGDILFKGKSLRSLSEQEMSLFRKDHIGFVFQNFNLIPHQTVLDNIMLPLYLTGLSKSEMLGKALAILKELEMEAFKDKNVKQLSGGQKQRVALARALINNPEIIVADEPTGSLDSKSQKMVLDIFKKLSQAGKTILIVTHNPEVADYADVIIKMKDGEILEQTRRD